MIQSINFPICKSSIRPYGSWERLAEQLQLLGLDGVEGIAVPDDLDTAFPAKLMTGYHLTFYADWLDFYRRDEAALMEKFGSWDMVGRVYQGTEPEALMRQYRDDLALACRLGADYTVFHVSDVSIEECFTYRWRHTDREVLDAAIEVINELLRGVEPTFDFLVENQWWPGFTFTEPEKTDYLLSHIDYPRKGIMLDTGHLMNSEPRLRSQAEGVDYILAMLERHGELSRAVRGMHFHQSVSGRYVRRCTGALPADFPQDYFEAFSVLYDHIRQIDRHRPWTDPTCAKVLDRVCPAWLTHELGSGPRRPQLASVRRQLSTLRRAKESGERSEKSR